MQHVKTLLCIGLFSFSLDALQIDIPRSRSVSPKQETQAAVNAQQYFSPQLEKQRKLRAEVVDYTVKINGAENGITFSETVLKKCEYFNSMLNATNFTITLPKSAYLTAENESADAVTLQELRAILEIVPQDSHCGDTDLKKKWFASKEFSARKLVALWQVAQLFHINPLSVVTLEKMSEHFKKQYREQNIFEPAFLVLPLATQQAVIKNALLGSDVLMLFLQEKYKELQKQKNCTSPKNQHDSIYAYDLNGRWDMRLSKRFVELSIAQFELIHTIISSQKYAFTHETAKLYNSLPAQWKTALAMKFPFSLRDTCMLNIATLSAQWKMNTMAVFAVCAIVVYIFVAKKKGA